MVESGGRRVNRLLRSRCCGLKVAGYYGSTTDEHPWTLINTPAGEAPALRFHSGFNVQSSMFARIGCSQYIGDTLFIDGYVSNSAGQPSNPLPAACRQLGWIWQFWRSAALGGARPMKSEAPLTLGNGSRSRPAAISAGSPEDCAFPWHANLRPAGWEGRRGEAVRSRASWCGCGHESAAL